MSDVLDEFERDLLDFERGWWRSPVAKHRAVHERFGVSMTRYYLMLNQLIDREAAMKHDPLLVKRLRRLRITRRAVARTPRH